MALKPCPHCGHNVSDKATKCPQCGKDPRFTSHQLEQKAVQRKKSIRILTISAVIIFIALCAVFIPYFLKLKSYNAAQSLFDEGYYSQAVLVFDELGNYKDSVQKGLDARYQYAYSNQDRKNPTTLEYVEHLIDAGYPNSVALSDEIYKWTGVSYAARREGGIPVLADFGKDDPLYLYLDIQGGQPGEEVEVQYRIDYYASGGAKLSGAPLESEYKTFPDKLKDGESAYVYWESGVGTTRYEWITITFYHAEEVLSSTDVRIRTGSKSQTYREPYAVPDASYSESTTFSDETHTDTTTEETAESPSDNIIGDLPSNLPSDTQNDNPTDTTGDIVDDSEGAERTIRIYNSDAEQWEWVAPGDTRDDQQTENSHKKQEYVRQYNPETDTWDWTWVDAD